MSDENWDDYAATWANDPAVKLDSDRAFSSLQDHVAPVLRENTIGRYLASLLGPL
jgi:hypothetical protein